MKNEKITREKLEEYLKTKGMTWLVGALVEGSIGYHTPKGAVIIIESALAGETKNYCERCSALFGGDLLEMITNDIKRMEYLESNDPKRVKRVVAYVEKIIKMSDISQMTASMMYPTQV